MTTRKILIIQRYIEGKSFKFFTLKLYGSNTTHEVFSIQKVWVENDPRSIFLIKSMGRIQPTKYNVGVLC